MPIEDSERNELLDMSRDWQAQLNCLWARVEELGYQVYYDSEGKPAIKPRGWK